MHVRRIPPSLFLVTLILVNMQASSIDDRDDMLRKMYERAEHYGQLSRRIWEFAEVGYKEKQSSELLKAELRAAGFQIMDHVGEIPTAFTASQTSGEPFQDPPTPTWDRGRALVALGIHEVPFAHLDANTLAMCEA
jgi:aminobenzoyl-glutamate utilization protein B